MLKQFKGTMELDGLGKFIECSVADSIYARVQARIVTSDPTWGSGVLRFHGSINGETYHEIDATKTLTAAGILAAALDVTGIKLLRVVVGTAGTAGALVEVFVSAMNPYR